jgi:hypothetical protein
LGTYPLNSSTFFLRDADSLSPWWERSIIVTILAQQLQELLRVLSDQLCQLWVTSAYLLEDGLEHLGLLLHDLTKLLELGIVTEEIEVAKSTTGCGCCCSCSSRSEEISCSTASTCSTSSTGCGCCLLEKVDWFLSAFTTFASWRSGGWGSGLTASSWSRLSLFLLKSFWDALKTSQISYKFRTENLRSRGTQ